MFCTTDLVSPPLDMVLRLVRVDVSEPTVSLGVREGVRVDVRVVEVGFVVDLERALLVVRSAGALLKPLEDSFVVLRILGVSPIVVSKFRRCLVAGVVDIRVVTQGRTVPCDQLK